jgi:cell division inhibitor SepF
MSALRKAGVWLGLIEDDGNYGYDDRSYDEDYPDDEFADAGSVVRTRVADRLAEQRAERNHTASERSHSEREADRAERAGRADQGGHGLSSVRQLGRHDREPAAARSGGDSGTTYPVQDNLALAPIPEAIATQRDTAIVPRPAAVIATDERRYQITTLHPASFNDARTIGEHFRDGVPVILNITEMAEADAKRLVDFAAGLAFGLRGTMERVANRVFLLSPANIQVTAEDKAKIAEGGFFYQ